MLWCDVDLYQFGFDGAESESELRLMIGAISIITPVISVSGDG